MQNTTAPGMVLQTWMDAYPSSSRIKDWHLLLEWNSNPGQNTACTEYCCSVEHTQSSCSNRLVSQNLSIQDSNQLTLLKYIINILLERWELREKYQLFSLHKQYILPLWGVLQWSYRTDWSPEDTKGKECDGWQRRWWTWNNQLVHTTHEWNSQETNLKQTKKSTSSPSTSLNCGTRCCRKPWRPKQVQKVIRKLNGRRFNKVH